MRGAGGWMLLAALAACGAPAGHTPADATARDSTVRAPDSSLVPGGALGLSIHRGLAILNATRDSLPANVGSTLRCTSCHLQNGRNPDALPLTGVYARFPQYRARAGAVQRLEDRINDCLLRSLNGKALSFEDPAM